MRIERNGNGQVGTGRLSLVAVLCLLVGTRAMALSPVEAHGGLSILDSSLVDSSKKVVALRGVSLCDHNMTGCMEFLNKSAMQFAMTDWRASSFRVRIKAEDVAFGGVTLKGAISDTGTALAYARRAISIAVELGTYVVVDWQANGLHTDAAKTFFGKLAREYGNTPNILWEICGEPNGVGGTEIANYAKAVLGEIRPYSRNVVIVGTSNWSQNPQEAGTELQAYGNVAYAFHFHSGSSLSSVVSQAKAKKNAVLATEWVMAAASGEGGLQSIEGGGGTNIKDWVARLDSGMVSHWNASLGNRLGVEGAAVATECALKSRVSFQGGWGDSELSESGLSIRAYLRAKNPQWTLPDTTTRIIERFMVVKTSKENPVLGIDTVIFTAQFNRPVSWTVTETGLNTKATRTTKGTGMVVDFRHVAGAKNLLSPSFMAGESVQVALYPFDAKDAYELGVSTGVRMAESESPLRWDGTSLFLPGDKARVGSAAIVTVRNLSGRILTRNAVRVGEKGRVDVRRELSAGNAVLVLDVETEQGYAFRGRLGPDFRAPSFPRP